MKITFHRTTYTKFIDLSPGLYRDETGRLLIIASKPIFCTVNRYWLGVLTIENNGGPPGYIANERYGNDMIFHQVGSVTIEV